jgi:hypothetical protein
MTVQLVAGGEYSTIEQEGPGGKRRSFFRPKGSLSVSAKLTPTFSANFKAIRRVGQLNFGQFLARVFLDNDIKNVGNPDLVPTQQWRFELELAKDLGAYGTTRVNLAASLQEDLVDIIPIGESGESPGNIDSGQAYAVDWVSTFQLDPLGLKGARVNLRALVQVSRVEDRSQAARATSAASQTGWWISRTVTTFPKATGRMAPTPITTTSPARSALTRSDASSKDQCSPACSSRTRTCSVSPCARRRAISSTRAAAGTEWSTTVDATELPSASSRRETV